jgi:hypothetical protein
MTSSARGEGVGKVEVLAAIRDAVRAAGGVRAFSRKTGINKATVSLVINGHSEPAESLVNAVGYMAVTIYRPIAAARRNAA